MPGAVCQGRRHQRYMQCCTDVMSFGAYWGDAGAGGRGPCDARRPDRPGTLRQAGMAVDTAYDGAAGLDAAVHTPYDVIVLDRDLPVAQGNQVCRTMAGSGPRILMLTAAAAVDDRVEGSQTTTSESRSRLPSSSPVCGCCLAAPRRRRRSCARGTSSWTARGTAPAAARARCP
jgi:CheY-like chemotaxis protein